MNISPLPAGEGKGEGKNMSRVTSKLSLFTAGLARHIEVWRTAWQEQKRQEPVVVPQGRELEFLPAVLEIQE